MRAGGGGGIDELGGMGVPTPELNEENLALEAEIGRGGDEARGHLQLVAGRVHNRIVVPEEEKHWTRVALDRMLSIQ